MSLWHICGPLELEKGSGGLQRRGAGGKGTGAQVEAEGLGHLL